MNNISFKNKGGNYNAQSASLALGIATLALLSAPQTTWAADLKKYDVKCGDQLCGTFEIDLDEYKEYKNTPGNNSNLWRGGVNIGGKFVPKKNNEFHYIQSVKDNTDHFRWINDASVPLPEPYLDPPPGGYKVRTDVGANTFVDQPFDYLPWYDEGEFPLFSDAPNSRLPYAKTKKVELLFETWIVCVIDKKIIPNTIAKDDTYNVAPLWGFQWGYTIDYKDVGVIGTDEPADFTVTKVDFTPLVTPSADWNKATSSATKYGAGDKQDFWNITKGDCKDCVTLDARKVPEPSSILGILAIGTLGAASTLKRKLKPSQSTEKETTKVS
jgi:hypothetical protein